MFYKKESNDKWVVGVIVILPTNPTTELNENNRENDYGWEWHDNPPQEYLDWINEQENIE